MAKSKRPPQRGRPLTEGVPLNHRVCGYFSEEEYRGLERVSRQLSAEEGAKVSVAEIVRRAVREYLGRRK